MISEKFLFSTVLFAIVLYQSLPFLFGIPKLNSLWYSTYQRLNGVIASFFACGLVCILAAWRSKIDIYIGETRRKIAYAAIICCLLSAVMVIGQKLIVYMTHGDTLLMIFMLFYSAVLYALALWLFLYYLTECGLTQSASDAYVEWFTFVSVYSASWILAERSDIVKTAPELFALTLNSSLLCTALICCIPLEMVACKERMDASLRLLLLLLHGKAVSKQPIKDKQTDVSLYPRAPYELMLALTAAALVSTFAKLGSFDVSHRIFIIILLVLNTLLAALSIADYFITQCVHNDKEVHIIRLFTLDVPVYLCFSAWLTCVSLLCCAFYWTFSDVVLWATVIFSVVCMGALYYVNFHEPHIVQRSSIDAAVFTVLLAFVVYLVCGGLLSIVDSNVFHLPVCDSTASPFRDAVIKDADLTQYLHQNVNSNGNVAFNMALSIGFHNSYHQSGPLGNIVYEYGRSYPSLPQQLDMGMRELEIDVHYDPNSDQFLVYHIEAFDARSSCKCLSECLHLVTSWMDRNADHTPILIRIEPRGMNTAALWCGEYNEDGGRLTRKLINQLNGTLGKHLYTPKHLIGDVHWENKTYTAVRAIQDRKGWPSINELRGKVILVWNIFEKNEHCRDFYYMHLDPKHHILFDRLKEESGSNRYAAERLLNGKAASNEERYSIFMEASECGKHESRKYREKGFHTRLRDHSSPPLPMQQPYNYVISSSIVYSKPISVWSDT